LFVASDSEFRGILALLLSGLTAGEVVALKRGDLDRVNGVVRIEGEVARAIVLPPSLLPWLPTTMTPEDAPLFVAPGDRPLAETTVATALLYAAHDANLDDADSVTPDALRHTYIAFLVRQGMRFAELARVVGTLPADRLAAYRRLAPAGTAGAPELVLPAVRQATLV
jgi:integrase